MCLHTLLCCHSNRAAVVVREEGAWPWSPDLAVAHPEGLTSCRTGFCHEDAMHLWTPEGRPKSENIFMRTAPCYVIAPPPRYCKVPGSWEERTNLKVGKHDSVLACRWIPNRGQERERHGPSFCQSPFSSQIPSASGTPSTQSACCRVGDCLRNSEGQVHGQERLSSWQGSTGWWRECVLRCRKVCRGWKERALKFSMRFHDRDWTDCCRLVGSWGGSYRKKIERWAEGPAGQMVPARRARRRQAAVTSECVGLGDGKLQSTGSAAGRHAQFFAERQKGEILAWGHPYLSPKIRINLGIFIKTYIEDNYFLFHLVIRCWLHGVG